MSRFRMLLLASAAVVIGACSDTQSPTAPATDSDPALKQRTPLKELTGVWGNAGDAAALKLDADPVHSPLLCNQGGSGPECLRVYHNGQFVQRVFHRGKAKGTGCSRSVIRIAGVVRGRSGYVCHVKNDILFFTWYIQEFWPFGTRIQVDFTGGGSSSPAGSVYTNYR